MSLYSYFYVLSRLAQEGSLMTIPFMTKRTIRPSVKDLEILLLSSDTEMPPSHDQLVSTNFEKYIIRFLRFHSPFLTQVCTVVLKRKFKSTVL